MKIVVAAAKPSDGNFTNTTGSNTTTSALRKSMSCKYWHEATSEWISRGVFLRGMSFVSTVPGAAAVCVSSHLTLFAVEDDSEAVKLVDAKISAISERFDDMKAVDLLDGNTEINAAVPITFGVATGLFFALVVASKCQNQRQRNRSTLQAKRVFLLDGELARPDVMRSQEMESVLRGWLLPKQVVWLLFLNAITNNAVLALLFTWSHDNTVFTRADKAVILYASILSTFLAVAFFEGESSNVEYNFWISMLDAFLSSALANVILFPIQYFLPFMISNVCLLYTSPSPRDRG